jgi:CelD/BcsL family acetyltransferase involved in cellulose biosynthesis
MNIECYRSADVFEMMSAEWNELVSRSLTNTPFQRAEFQQGWWKHFGSGGLCVLVFREGGALKGIAPMFVDKDGIGRWVGGEEIADYLDVIAPAEDMEAATQAMWRWLTSEAAPPWRRMILSNIPEWTQTPERLAALAIADGLKAEVTQLDVCPIIQLPDSFESYLKQIDSKQRHEINRKLRKAQGSEDPVAWYVVDHHRDLAAETEAFMALMETASADKAAFLTPKMRSAFHDIFAAMHQSGLLQLAFLEVGSVRAAAYAQFDYAGRIWVYNSGINPDVGGTLSTGWVLLARLIEQAIANKRTIYDLMQGAEDYKYRFGGKDTVVRRVTIER